ncbi:RluA family pseudouridine synthase [Mechercharimyces sp. CAU 1602]|uniref:RluA family pseudouridine synthase n=1 Tax=Mechercharimyces sp. CAU 1602 TaxID=2973933 RepID=UPI002161E4C2|nr:RluA family pseudouridine synthase [Mechercharimyces sp. CAU 1602]MCS1350645.1 RluA family pseudouridine synthase [Mechercharimyces sp. CAU 1602]
MSELENNSMIVQPEDQGDRLDKFVAQQDESWSRVMVQSWIREGNVLVDGKTVKSNYKIKAGNEVSITIPDPGEMQVEPENISLDIRYEDEDVIVVNKPRGMVVHPGAGNQTGTLVHALLYHCKDLSGIGGVLRPGIVHRIDKDTSGLLMIAKNDSAHQSLVAQLQAREVERRYVAAVRGIIPHETGTIDAPIGRDPRNRQRMTVIHENSRPAVTHFRVLKRFAETTWIECKLETGRTHQIRVHMKHIGHSLLADPVYGPKKNRYPIMEGQALHAQVLGFTHPRTGETVRLEAELPSDMKALYQQLATE